ncbi:hypothetical protein, partial [Paraburkholderia atlantica]|uniref:hypothetical protein n=1 Tax=Paraburkholderia atlantica TaxID=2654982 RepID=UPI001C848576
MPSASPWTANNDGASPGKSSRKDNREVDRVGNVVIRVGVEAGSYDRMPKVSDDADDEPHRILWRLEFLRESSHEQEGNEVFPGSPGA